MIHGYQIWKQCHIHFWKWDKTVKSLMIILGKISQYSPYQRKHLGMDRACFMLFLIRFSWIPPSHPAENHWELRYKIVYEGFEKFIDKLEWPNDPKVGSKLDWKNNMTSPSTWGDEIVLQLASNLLEVDIHIISAFPVSGSNGVTIIKPVDLSSQKQPIYLFLFPETDFVSAHYQSEESIRDIQVVVSDQPCR